VSDAVVGITIALIGFAGVVIAALIGSRRKQQARDDEWKRKSDELDARVAADTVARVGYLEALVEDRNRRVDQLEAQLDHRDHERDRDRDRERDPGRDSARDIGRDRMHDRDQRRSRGRGPEDRG
jgi:hypothetical protein